MDNPILFLDLETTGLEVDAEILEVGVILTEGPGLDIVAGTGRSFVVHHNHPELLKLGRHPAVVDMHEKSGLWADLSAPLTGIYRQTLPEIEDWILGVLHMHGVEPGKAMLAGYSCHTDRRWLEGRMPHLLRFVSHRMIDVSTVRHLYWATRGERPKTEGAHRALVDCSEARMELLRYLPLLAGLRGPIEEETS
jgi:oligoribonuclease